MIIGNRIVLSTHKKDSLGGIERAVRFAPRRQETLAVIFCGDEKVENNLPFYGYCDPGFGYLGEWV